MNVFDFMRSAENTDDKYQSFCPHTGDDLYVDRPSPRGAPTNKTNRCGAPVRIPANRILLAERAGKGVVTVRCPRCKKTRHIPTRAHRSVR